MMHELPENAQRAIKESLDKEGAARSTPQSQARHRDDGPPTERIR
jgi:hypothetical protein